MTGTNHRVNVLEPRWDEIGVGAAQASNGYWILVTDFGNIDGDAMPPIADVSPGGQYSQPFDHHRGYSSKRSVLYADPAIR